VRWLQAWEPCQHGQAPGADGGSAEAWDVAGMHRWCSRQGATADWTQVTL
jgi:hypothetical protein